MNDRENITVLCMNCKVTFVTSRDSFEDRTTSCPACGEKKLGEKG